MRLFFGVGAALAIMAVAPSLQARTKFELNLAGFFNVAPRCHRVVPVYPVRERIIVHRPCYEPVYIYDPGFCRPVYAPRYLVPVRVDYGTPPPMERIYY
jgi:hypothetical protein